MCPIHGCQEGRQVDTHSDHIVPATLPCKPECQTSDARQIGLQYALVQNAMIVRDLGSHDGTTENGRTSLAEPGRVRRQWQATGRWAGGREGTCPTDRTIGPAANEREGKKWQESSEWRRTHGFMGGAAVQILIFSPLFSRDLKEKYSRPGCLSRCSASGLSDVGFFAVSL